MLSSTKRTTSGSLAESALWDRRVWENVAPSSTPHGSSLTRQCVQLLLDEHSLRNILQSHLTWNTKRDHPQCAPGSQPNCVPRGKAVCNTSSLRRTCVEDGGQHRLCTKLKWDSCEQGGQKKHRDLVSNDGCASGLLGNQTPWPHSFQAKSSEGEEKTEQRKEMFEVLVC